MIISTVDRAITALNIPEERVLRVGGAGNKCFLVAAVRLAVYLILIDLIIYLFLILFFILSFFQFILLFVK